jgi:hypothetical protein
VVHGAARFSLNPGLSNIQHPTIHYPTENTDALEDAFPTAPNGNSRNNRERGRMSAESRLKKLIKKGASLALFAPVALTSNLAALKKKHEFLFFGSNWVVAQMGEALRTANSESAYYLLSAVSC